ncbi:hypothetical protein DPMN_191540 [Dreissena polymorpha]|uniref:Uncharacterized protein n=1 Tax=Dreissena polymorpha TaxID=45954 RepID=A0A9D3Y5C8_DREPO|nr:hypothetical protein DPMN_191540 [Dreissena polymorpha]
MPLQTLQLKAAAQAEHAVQWRLIQRKVLTQEMLQDSVSGTNFLIIYMVATKELIAFLDDPTTARLCLLFHDSKQKI